MRQLIPIPAPLRPARALALSCALLLGARALVAQEPVAADAYRDAGARELVRLARARRATVDTRITAYETTARERLAAYVGIGGFDRLLVRRETVSRVEWTRDTVRIRLLGAREVQPLVGRGARLPPAFVAGSMPALAFDPVDSEMLLRVDSTVIRNPLAPGSEAYYRFTSGDSTAIRLPDGRVVRLLELRIAARRPDRHLVNGSFWLDADSHAVVRAALRLSQPLRAGRSGLSLLVPEVTGELEHIGIEYALWDLHWWLPRAVVVRGSGRVAGVRVSLAFEREYEGYRVVGDTLAPVPPAAAALARSEARPCRPQFYGGIILGGAPADSAWNVAFRRQALLIARPDTALDAPTPQEAATERRRRRPGHPADTIPCERAFLVTRAEGNLVTSPVFKEDIYQASERTLEAEQLRALSQAFPHIPGSPWSVSAPGVQLLPADLLRYNRVEGFSGGARAVLPLGGAELRGELRAGTTGEVGARLGGVRSGPGTRAELGVYRALQAVDMAAQPFSLTSSASALVFGRDENDYFRASGAELRLSPVGSSAGSWELRLFAERQEPVRARAGAGLRGLLDDGFEVRPNLTAERIAQAGAALRLRARLGDDPARPRGSAEWRLEAQTGDRTFGRAFLRASAELPLGRGASLTLSGAEGNALGGEVPVQALWQIGGAATVRGHDPAAMRGRSMSLQRLELAFGPPATRLALFGDMGTAGGRAWGGDTRSIAGAGAGISLLGNLVRVDVARGSGWKGYLRIGAEF